MTSLCHFVMFPGQRNLHTLGSSGFIFMIPALFLVYGGFPSAQAIPTNLLLIASQHGCSLDVQCIFQKCIYFFCPFENAIYVYIFDGCTFPSLLIASYMLESYLSQTFMHCGLETFTCVPPQEAVPAAVTVCFTIVYVNFLFVRLNIFYTFS